ncbi:MAG: hypothetical protein AAGG51_05560 [Cyanobacteria bacterium P01_G01_bin.54]
MTQTTEQRSLGLLAVTTLLVSAHYGSGFILGTAEQVATVGAIGSLYAVAVGLGSIALALLARLYWQRIDPIWSLLGDRYGPFVKLGIGLMSWTSLIGIGAVQIIAVAAITQLVELPRTPTMGAIALALSLIALLPVERASWLFRGLLLLNVGVLCGALVRLHGFGQYPPTIVDFMPVAVTASPRDLIGILGSTVFLVLVDMKCQQFVVRARSLTISVWGCILSGLVLVLLAFLPTTLVFAAQKAQIAPADLPAASLIPYVLNWLGQGLGQPWGALFVLSLALPALGLGSNVIRIQTKALLDLTQREATPPNQWGFTLLNTLLALGIALHGGEIVGLIVCFYAAYLAAVWLPFTAYLLDVGQVVPFSRSTVQWALGTGAIASLSGLGLGIFAPSLVWFNSPELTILALGLGSGAIVLVAGQLVDALLPQGVQKDFKG